MGLSWYIELAHRALDCNHCLSHLSSLSRVLISSLVTFFPVTSTAFCGAVTYDTKIEVSIGSIDTQYTADRLDWCSDQVQVYYQYGSTGSI